MKSRLKQASWERIVIPLLVSVRGPGASEEPSRMPPDLICPPWLIWPLNECSQSRAARPPSQSGVLLVEPLVKSDFAGGVQKRYKKKQTLVFMVSCVTQSSAGCFCKWQFLYPVQSTVGCVTYSWLIQVIVGKGPFTVVDLGEKCFIPLFQNLSVLWKGALKALTNKQSWKDMSKWHRGVSGFSWKRVECKEWWIPINVARSGAGGFRRSAWVPPSSPTGLLTSLNPPYLGAKHVYICFLRTENVAHR